MTILLCSSAEWAEAQTEAASAPSAGRASWLSDRIPLRVGDILTIVVDEQSTARERVSRIASSDREQSANLSGSVDTSPLSGSGSAGFGTGIGADSKDVGEANRQGDLAAVLSVRVVQIEPNGVARIEGEKVVTVDGRDQEVTLEGFVRPEDVSSTNLVLSSRIVGASISYDGDNVGPRRGILGKILGIFWP
jgi:flagellar L-ring protein precursor FlgH